MLIDVSILYFYICLCVRLCVTDVTSANKARLDENMREDCDVITLVLS